MGKGTGEHHMKDKFPKQVYLRIFGYRTKVYVGAGPLRSALKTSGCWPGRIFDVMHVTAGGTIMWRDCTHEFVDENGKPR